MIVLAIVLLGLSGPALAALTALAAPAVGATTWFFTRRHTEDVEDADAMSRAIVAVTDANSALTATTLTIIAPLQQRIVALEAANKALSDVQEQRTVEHDKLMVDVAAMQLQMRVVIDYVHTLRAQIVKMGSEPVPIPEELDGFTFD